MKPWVRVWGLHFVKAGYQLMLFDIDSERLDRAKAQVEHSLVTLLRENAPSVEMWKKGVNPNLSKD